MHQRLNILLLFNLDGPEAFYTVLIRLFGRRVVMAFVRVGFGDTQGEHGKREELEGFFCAGEVGNGREERVGS
jgi:hypothetical protein